MSRKGDPLEATFKLSLSVGGASTGEFNQLDLTLWLSDGHIDIAITPALPQADGDWETIVHFPPAEAHAFARFFRTADKVAAAYRRTAT